jgi:hypothetical protein
MSTPGSAGARAGRAISHIRATSKGVLGIVARKAARTHGLYERINARKLTFLQYAPRPSPR